MRLKISARKSDLARLQAYLVGEALQSKHPHLRIDYDFKESLGDKNLTDPLWKMPEKGVFTEDFNQDLLSGATDMVVHSWKDLPTQERPGFHIAATLPRADQRDLLLVKKSHFARIRQKQKLQVYSSSPRRAYNLESFLQECLPFSLQQVNFESVRGNIPTRIRKLLADPEIDALILAKAALDRLLAAPQEEFATTRHDLRQALEQVEWMVLPLSVNPNAAAQGALAIEVLRTRSDLNQLLASINDPETFHCATAERKVLASFGGGCHQKIGVAVLSRAYGQVQILKGLTDLGQTLDQHEILRESSARFDKNDMWPPENVSFKTHRESLAATVPTDADALFVAKAEAWPAELQFKGILWTAGLTTWRKLAQQGIWVHGSSEGLGENEEPLIETLAFKALRWYKLTHSQGADDGKHPVATYHLNFPEALPELEGKKAFYWSSGSQFVQALQQHPAVADAFHACGPGHTYQTLRAELEKRGLDPESRLQIFLSPQEWRKKCQK